MKRIAAPHRHGLLLLTLGLCACGQLDPKKDIGVSIESPAIVTVGTPFEIRAIVRNNGTAPARLDSIDIGDSYLEDVSIQSADPPWRATLHVPIDDTLSHEFQAEVPAGASLTVSFRAVATRPGKSAGDFDICVNTAVDCFFEKIATEAR